MDRHVLYEAIGIGIGQSIKADGARPRVGLWCVDGPRIVSGNGTSLSHAFMVIHPCPAVNGQLRRCDGYRKEYRVGVVATSFLT